MTFELRHPNTADRQSGRILELMQRVDVLERMIGNKGVIVHGVGSGSPEPGFQNSWLNYDGGGPTGHQNLIFFKIGWMGFVQGTIKNGTVGVGVPVFNLPTRNRPLSIAQSIQRGPTDLPVVVNVNVNGDFCIVAANGGNSAISVNVFYLTNTYE